MTVICFVHPEALSEATILQVTKNETIGACVACHSTKIIFFLKANGSVWAFRLSV
jgi:hypothetical protein